MKNWGRQIGHLSPSKRDAASFFMESFSNYTERQDQLGKGRQEEPGYRYQRKKIQN